MFDVEKIVKYLKPYSGKLEQLYDWETNFNFLFETPLKYRDKVEKLMVEKNHFKKDVIFKEIMSRNLCYYYKYEQNNFYDLAHKIIHDWGGIKTGNKQKAKEFIDYFLEKKDIQFNRIASISKVAGLMYPDKFIIYDSRVSYTMNWILLSQEAGNFYFPVPEGRNSKMLAFDINVLIRLKNTENYQMSDKERKIKNFLSERDSKLYIEKNKAYKTMNKLITDVNKALWDDDRKNEPFYTEMLLFAMADTTVYNEITKFVRINIRNNGNG